METELQKLNGQPCLPKVSIIMLNWNGKKDTLECLDSVRKIDYSNFDTIVVDNGSSDDSVKVIREKYPELKVFINQDRKWTWRFGLAYDQTPVPDAAYRTARIPDADRTWLAVGGQCRLSQKSAVDFGYAHLFVNDARINHTEANVPLTGTYRDHVDILGAQYTHSF